MIAIRFDPALIITTADRIVHESRTFEIKGLHQEHEDRRTIILECLESTT
jgi:head-tail adaptor